MEDAYLIGIRLALDNGVSAGVAAIRQDLGGLDRAIATTAASLRELAGLASASHAIAGQLPQPKATERAGEPRPSELPPTAMPAHHPVPTGGIAQPPPIATPQSDIPFPMPPQQSPPTPKSPVPAPPTILQPLAPAAETITRARPFITAMPAPIPSQRVNPSVAVPSFVSSPSAPPPIVTGAPARPDKPVAHSPSSPSRADSPSIRPETAARITKGSEPSTPSSPSLQRPAPMPQTAAPRFAAPAASPSPPSHLAPAHAAVMLPSAAPHSPAQSTGPTNGDVFLDGTRVGHWLANHLAREAGRPPSGATGFDPRLGVSWPGTQQGGG